MIWLALVAIVVLAVIGGIARKRARCEDWRAMGSGRR
jgi:hypothetical protein